MRIREKTRIAAFIVACACTIAEIALPALASEDTLTVYEVQYSTAESEWKSAYEGRIVSIVGGIVTHKAGLRITLQDPTVGDAWAGIEIRAFENEAPLGAVSVGDRVDFFDVLVEEFVGGTIPQFKNYSGFQIASSGNPLPEPVLVSSEDLRLPPDRERCEKYEGMLVAVEDVRVGRMDLGKAEDNYELIADGDTLWGSDYYNLDLAVPPFPTYYVSRGQRYQRLAGVFQEYSRPENGWDYYQLLPRGTADYEKSDIYTIRDVQESDSEQSWASPLEGQRVRVQGIVSSERSESGILSLIDPLLGGAWAGVWVADVAGELGDLRVGDEIDLSNVRVEEREGLTILGFDVQSTYTLLSSGNPVAGVVIAAGDLGVAAGPEAAEKYEGMLVSLYNLSVAERGVAEGAEFYYLVCDGDTVLVTDLENGATPPGSTFFVRTGDRLGRIRGIVIDEDLAGEHRYVLQPRGVEDYWFVSGSQSLTSWGRMKRQYRQEGL